MSSVLDSILTHSPTSWDVLVSLRKDILTGKIGKGVHLKKMELADRFGVSRGSVSQALYKLEMEGLVHGEHNGHVIVIGITEKDIIDMFEVRLYLEKEAMRILRNQDYVEYSPLLQVIKSMKEENDKGENADPVRMAQIGFNVHKAMLEISGNRALYQAWKGASGLMQEIMNINGSHVSAQETYNKHKILSDCIIQKWPDSVQVIEKHLMAGSRDVYLDALRNIKRPEDQRVQLSMRSDRFLKSAFV
jgi:DNA-binding GntR family transcriptional regulator